MKNVTISMDEALYAEIRVDAAKARKSMSRYIADTMRSKQETAGPKTVRRNPQIEALERIFAGPKWDVTDNGRMPTAEERNAR
jgi:hypothetical protein